MTRDAKIELTDDQLARLGVHISTHMAQHPPTCQVFSGDEIVWFKSCHQAALKTKSVALATTVGFFVIGMIGIIGAGVIHWAKTNLGIKEAP